MDFSFVLWVQTGMLVMRQLHACTMHLLSAVYHRYRSHILEFFVAYKITNINFKKSLFRDYDVGYTATDFISS